ncbi:MAG: anthranilate phosphoribosyltransferase [Mariprofundaceae bacterium]|nr:anthranilate phosphoribosyltransferase [Mariprofundaceae bacterium]
MTDTTIDIAAGIHRIARGKHGAENLNRQDAAALFAALLAADADPLQRGAFLIAERMKGETQVELAGFVDAARASIEAFGNISMPQGAVDFPCYAGKRRAAPVHLAAALMARDRGVAVLVHGVAAIEGRISAWQVLQKAGVSRATNIAEAASCLHSEGIVYLDIADYCPGLFDVLALRSRLGVRSFAHTVARLLNPLNCAGQLNGIFHTPYATLMTQVNVLLGQPRSLIFAGAEGDPELYADRQKALFAQIGDSVSACSYAAAGCALYPRQAVADVQALCVSLSSFVEGAGNTREQVVMRRMHQAFDFASAGAWPVDWKKED